MNWPKQYSPNGNAKAFLFTCGLDRKTMMAFMASLFVSRAVQMSRTVIACNIQRGRDQDSNSLRETVNAHQADRELLIKIHSMRNQGPDYKTATDIMTDNLHRGRQMINIFLSHCYNSVKGHIEVRPSYARRFVEMTKPVFQSYRQAVKIPFMDSVVFTMPHGVSGSYKDAIGVYTDIAGRDPRTVLPKINALRAVRTMRINGTLASS